jgi:hypothetical protein
MTIQSGVATTPVVQQWPFFNFTGELYGICVPSCSDCHRGKRDDFHGVQPFRSLENQAMEILITLVLIGLVVYLFPYILAAFMMFVALFVAVFAAFVYIVKRLFSR